MSNSTQVQNTRALSSTQFGISGQGSDVTRLVEAGHLNGPAPFPLTTGTITLFDNTIQACLYKPLLVDGSGMTTDVLISLGEDTQERALELLTLFGIVDSADPFAYMFARITANSANERILLGNSSGTADYVTVNGLTSSRIAVNGAAAQYGSIKIYVTGDPVAKTINFKVLEYAND
jgi:hypothetical protein